MRLYKLNDDVLRIKGNAAKFLNGLTANTLEAPFNAFLNLHGRIVATFRQQKISEDEFLIAVPTSTVEPLLKHLNMYAKINHTTIEPTDLNVYLDVDSGNWLFKSDNIPSEVSNEEFTCYRLENNLPLMDVDYQAEEFLLNIDDHTFVSFTKGCFLGQEPVSKVHNRSKPTRKLVVKFEDECAEEEKAKLTSKTKDPQSNRVKGFIFVKNN